MALAAAEDVRLEVEAVLAVYGDDCRVIREFPPHLNVHIAPRTADDSSQQFVEVILGIRASEEYPEKPPHIYVTESKGLDENRQTYLISSIQNAAQELSSSFMLVALCEEAVEILSNMNHPEGNCALCLYPLFLEAVSGTSVPFMKLMSCYHCFHSACIIRWWKWHHEQNKTGDSSSIEARGFVGNQGGTDSNISQHQADCPVCRKPFDAKDIEHVLDDLETDLSQLNNAGMDTDEDEKLLLHSDSENNRRQNFETLLRLQQENCGLIEPRKNLTILPGMYLPTISAQPTISTDSNGEQCDNSGAKDTVDAKPNSTLENSTRFKQKNLNRRRNNFNRSRQQANVQIGGKQWVRKEPSSSEQ